MHAIEVHLLSEAGEHGHVEGAVDAAQVLANHLLGQSFASDEETGHGSRRILQEPPLDQVDNPLVRLFIEDIEAGSVMPFPNHFVDAVHVTDHVSRSHD